MTFKPVLMLTAITLLTLSSAGVSAAPPASYDDVIKAERERMISNYKKDGGDAVANQPSDESWLTNTPATWTYIINKERLRMKSSVPQTQAQPAASSRMSEQNSMPSTILESVQHEHQQMKNRH
jgi:hypothetical protein